MIKAGKLKKTVAATPGSQKTHERFLRYASLHSVNSSAATITPDDAAKMVRQYLESEVAR